MNQKRARQRQARKLKVFPAVVSEHSITDNAVENLHNNPPQWLRDEQEKYRRACEEERRARIQRFLLEATDDWFAARMIVTNKTPQGKEDIATFKRRGNRELIEARRTIKRWCATQPIDDIEKHLRVVHNDLHYPPHHVTAHNTDT